MDDVEINLKVIKGLLKKTQIQIDTAESGRKCLEYVKSKQYDLIFLDHMMPEMDGIETRQQMKLLTTDLNQNTPVIMLTANATRGTREEYMKAGFNDYLTKPFKEEDLQEMLITYLGEKIIRQSDEPCDGQKDYIREESMQHEKSENIEPCKEKDDIMQCLEEMPELDVQTGIQYCMDKEFYDEMLKEYMQSDKTAEIKRLYNTKDWKNYAISVHALKSTSLTIGAVSLLTQDVLDTSLYQKIIMWMQCAFGLMLGTELVWRKIKTYGKALVVTTLFQPRFPI